MNIDTWSIVTNYTDIDQDHALWLTAKQFRQIISRKHSGHIFLVSSYSDRMTYIHTDNRYKICKKRGCEWFAIYNNSIMELGEYDRNISWAPIKGSVNVCNNISNDLIGDILIDPTNFIVWYETTGTINLVLYDYSIHDRRGSHIIRSDNSHEEIVISNYNTVAYRFNNYYITHYFWSYDIYVSKYLDAYIFAINSDKRYNIVTTYEVYDPIKDAGTLFVYEPKRRGPLIFGRP